ncbi:MAG: bifunctional riboflavin kinase/FAD synthetase [Bacteroidota bacterium]
MRVYRDINEFNVKIPVVTIGTFDGVHKGHVKVIESLNKKAGEVGGESVIFTFWPHPRHVLSKNENIPVLTTIEERIELFQKAGVMHLIIFPFSKEFAMLSSEDFIRDIIVDKIRTKHLVIGYDHQFGKNREGNYDMLIKFSGLYGFTIDKIDPHHINDNNTSSTKIRTAIESGDLITAKTFLGYDYMLKGKVVKGDQLGRTLGFPTANILLGNQMKHIPKIGVYAVEIIYDNKFFQGMLNIGYRPTVSKNYKNRQIEVHIFKFDQQIYDEEISIIFKYRMRDEKKFDSIEGLKKQLYKDKIIAENFFNLKIS